MEKATSILIVDDHQIVSQGIQSLLTNMGFTACKHATTAATALSAVETQKFDIAIIDLELPDCPGISLIERIRKSSPATRIIVYTMHEELWALRDIEEARLNGIVFKSEPPQLLKDAVESVCKGSVYLSPHYQELRNGNHCTDIGYSAQQVLEFLAAGLSSKQIAEKVFRSENTVEYHRKRLMRFFGATNIAQLILKATQLGYIRPQADHT